MSSGARESNLGLDSLFENRHGSAEIVVREEVELLPSASIITWASGIRRAGALNRLADELVCQEGRTKAEHKATGMRERVGEGSA